MWDFSLGIRARVQGLEFRVWFVLGGLELGLGLNAYVSRVRK